jgi:hypothetical protein
MSEAATGAWTGEAADALAAMSEAPTMGISFFSIAGVCSTRSEEDDGKGEAVAVRMREWASVEGEKEGLYKDEGGVYHNTRPLCTAAACTAT